MEIGTVGVVGCGTMGAGICEVMARSGADVVFTEVDEAAVERGLARIRGSLDRAVERGKLAAEDREEVLGRISGSPDLGTLGPAGLVIEAVPEQLAVKRSVMERVGPLLRDDVVLGTNTSSLSVIDVAIATGRPDRVVGFHFFNPAPVMKLVELVKTPVTSPDVVARAHHVAEELGKTPVLVNDRAGFVANLLLFPYLNQAVGMVQEGYATREDVDAAMRLGCGHPMGPLALMDLIGLDSANAIMERMYEQFGDVRYAPRPLVRQLLSAGWKGRKSGIGFYPYVAEGRPERELDHAAADAGSAPDESLVAGWTDVAVIGTGTMATGIAEVCAVAGFQVTLRGRTMEKAEQAVAKVGAALAKAVERERLTAGERDAALARLHATADLADLADADIAIEALAEDLALKRAVFAEIDAAIKPQALLATATSSLSVVECAVATSRPERVVGMHFFNPASRMRLVELVDTVRSSIEAIAQANAFAARIDKHPVRCADRAGFVVNALLFPYLNDAVKMLEEGYASAPDIDAAMKLGCGHPMGPFELLDVVGLDIALEICRALHDEFRDPGFAPSALLANMVEAGYLGRKVGRGFYPYP